MIEYISIKNYQSLKNIELELGRLTIIVGTSSAGKSAFVRAMKMLASNERGFRFVTKGEKVSYVTAKLEDSSVTIERGENHGAYRLINNGKETTFTKLQGSVPELVTRTLRIKPFESGQSINFANQKDDPYLIDDSGQTVARVLGELTNVSTIFSAVREANRRRQNASNTAKMREQDLARLVTQAQQYADLSYKENTCSEAEEALKKAQVIGYQYDRLNSLLTDLTVASVALERAANVNSAPSPESLERAHSKHAGFLEFLSAISSTRKTIAAEESNISALIEKQNQLHEELHTILVEAGQCPTCGSSTKELERVL